MHRDGRLGCRRRRMQLAFNRRNAFSSSTRPARVSRVASPVTYAAVATKSVSGTMAALKAKGK